MPNIANHPRIEMVRTGDLKLDPLKLRIHSPRQIALLKNSISRFGFQVPVVVGLDNVVDAGNARVQAAKELGLEFVPVIRAEFLNENERRAFRLAENRIVELATWDDKKLKKELEHLFDGGLLEFTGFETKDLDFSVPEPAASGEPEKVELPAKNAKAVSRLGDKWVIGRHIICHRDATKPESFEAALDGELAGMVFGDLPFNLPIDGFVAGKGRHREFAMGSGEMSPPEFTAFLRAIFRNCARFSKGGSIHYQCMDWRHCREILDAADGVYSQFKQLVVWDKGVGGQGAFYRSQHELIFVFKSGSGKHINNFGLGETGRYRTNVVNYPGANAFRKGRKRDLDAHSTVKNSAMIADFILDCSNRGDIVLDATIGSGSTLLAAHRTGRRGVGIEIDGLYVDTALKRLSDATGLVPILAGDGRTFDEIRAARLAEGEA